MRACTMTTSGECAPAAAAKTIVVERPDQKNDLMDMLRRAAAASGRTPAALIQDIVATSFGPGKLSFDEYNLLALYDSTRYAGADLRNFVGLRLMREIWDQANFRTDLYGLVGNKIAMTALFEAHGLPVIPIAAVYSETGAQASTKALHSREALAAFLTNAEHFPLFGKPMDSRQSLGSAAFAGCDAATGRLRSDDGRTTALDDYIADIVAHYGEGYLFQPRLVPHAATRALCGNRLATVRVLTLYREGEVQIFRACEKMPAGANVADNFWRQGNLLIELDVASGTRKSTISGSGPAIRAHSHHPDSGAPIVGTVVPNWSALCELARQGARILKDTALIGWDLASTDDGAMIVEANYTPDMMLPQLADRKGVLDAELRAFLAERRRLEQAWKQSVRRELRASYRVSFWN